MTFMNIFGQSSTSLAGPLKVQATQTTPQYREVIEILSSDEEDAAAEGKPKQSDASTVTMPGLWPVSTIATPAGTPAYNKKATPPEDIIELSDEGSPQPSPRKTKQKTSSASSRKDWSPKKPGLLPLFADDSDASDDDKATTNSNDPQVPTSSSTSPPRTFPMQQGSHPVFEGVTWKRRDDGRVVMTYDEPRMSKPSTPVRSLRVDQQGNFPVFVDDIYRRQDDDGAIMTFDEPRSARKPTKLPLQQLKTIDFTPSPPASPKKKGTYTSRAPPLTPSSASGISAAKTGSQSIRTNKKAQAAADLARRKTYADDLFRELNTFVFSDKLPANTALNWSKRLTATAGRAKWHRSSQGIHTTEIELAEKILDCDERIRNTLSHEMCHLACWVIDGSPKEGHGNLFKSWASKVTDSYPEIEITTTHDYQISHPYQWQCGNCAKTYGRFSKSINTDAVVCGVCRTGRLKPLFNTARRAPKTPKISRNAATKPKDSPCTFPSTPTASEIDLLELAGSSTDESPVDLVEIPVSPVKGAEEILHLYSSDSEPDDEDIRILASMLGSVARITHD